MIAEPWPWIPATDLGKLIEINIKTGVARHFAIGLRNPQGLAIGRDGRIWETEHGPQGGDEVNLMVEARNYGWPIVTYGMTYGYPPKNWPFNPTPGAHDKVHAAALRIRTIGSDWQHHCTRSSGIPELGNKSDCMLTKGKHAFVLRMEGDDVAYAEPILLHGYRLADIVSLRDGRLAILADYGTLLLVRNAEVHRGDVQQIKVSGLTSLPRPSLDEAPAVTATREERGRHYFVAMCGKCHSLDGKVGVGRRSTA